MTGTRNELVRAIRSRVPDADSIDVELGAPGRPIVLVQPRPGADAEAVRHRVDELADELALAGMSYVVQIGPPSASTPPALRGPALLASFDSQPTRDGLIQALLRLVPEIGRVVMLPDGAGRINVLVATADGRAPPALLADARAAFAAVLAVGISAVVDALPAGDPRNDLERAGFLVPRRTPSLSQIARDEEERFAERIQRLVHGQIDEISLLDRHDGERIVVGSTGTGKARHPASLLPVYDRVFILMAPQCPPSDFATAHGVSEDDFVAFARTGRVVPVFRFDLGVYDPPFIGKLLEDPTIPMILPRDLDYAAARYAWINGSCGAPASVLRADRATTAAMHDIRRQLANARDAKSIALARTLDIALANAERFEGMFWREGHLALRHVSPGAHAVSLIAAHSESRRDTAGLMATLDVEGAVMSIALSQALDATLLDRLAQPQSLQFAARAFAAEKDTLASDTIPAVIEGLRIAYVPGLPIDEYIDLYDETETKRVRHLVRELLHDADPEDGVKRELRERLATLESQVAKIRKNAVQVDLADLLVNMSASRAPAMGAAAISSALVTMATNTVKKIGDTIIEDTALGGVVDDLRGAVNRVSGRAIRVYRLRSALDAMGAGPKRTPT